MPDSTDRSRIVRVSREIAAPQERIFELIADPSHQPTWDGNGNLDRADVGQRVRAIGDVFIMKLTTGALRENHVVEFEEGRLIAWQPSELGKARPGHLWRWELARLDEARTRVTHTYDWSELVDPNRMERARATTAINLEASISRLAEVAVERGA